MLFQAGFPDLQTREEASPVEKDGLEKVLETAVAVCRKKMFDYAPIDSGAIGSLAGAFGQENRVNSFAALASALSRIQSNRLEEQLLHHCRLPPAPADPYEAKKYAEKKKGVLEIALSRYLNALYEKAFPPAPVEQKGFEKKEVRFAANTRDWMVVKKTSRRKSSRAWQAFTRRP